MLTRYITKFNTLCRLIIVGLLIYPLPIYADHVPTQPPYDQSLSLDSTTGDVTVGIYTSDGFEDSPPEKYTIFFALDSDVGTSSYCVSTSFGHTGNLQWNNYVFKLDDLRTFFELPVGTFAIRIRSDNDTDNSYSTLTSQISVTLPNQTPFSDTQSNWSAPSSTCNDTSTTTTTTSSTTTTTTTTVPETTTTTSTTTTTVPPTTTTTTVPPTTTTTTSTTTTTTTTTTLPPPPPTTTTTLAPVIVKIGGEEVEYTQEELDDGTVERDIERQDNEDKYGCYMTNAQIDRGDCDIPKEEEKEEEVIIVVEDEQDTKTELPNDDVVVLDVADKDEDKDIIDEPIEEIIVIQKDLELTDQEEKELTEVIKEIQKQDLDEFAIEEEVIVFDLPEIIEIEQEDLNEEKITEPIKEVFEEDEIVDIEPDRQEEVGGRNNETPLDELPDEQQEEVIKQVEEKIQVVEITEDTTEAEIVEAVEALPVKEKIEVVKEVAKVKVQNLDKATEETKQIVQAVVVEVTKPETVAELSEEEKEVVAEVLGVVETNDVVIIAEQSVEDETIATAVQEYVERATENADVEDYGIQNVIVEIGIEQFVSDPIGQLTDIDLSDVVLSDIGSDMPEAVKTQAAKTVVPVIIVGQIIATPITRRF